MAENKDQSKPIAGGTTTGTSVSGTGVLTGGSGTAQMRDNPNESSAGMAASARQYADDMASRAKEKGRSLFDQQKESALGQVSSVAGAIRNTAQNLQGEGQDQTARYVQLIADQLESLGGRLRNKDLDSLVRDAEGYARRSPGTFLVGSMVAGFLLARFLKSSSERQAYRGDWEDEATISAGEAGAYTGTGGTAGTAAASRVGADGTPATGASTTGGVTGSNIGGNAP